MSGLSYRFCAQLRRVVCCLFSVGMLTSLLPAMAQLPGELSGQWFNPEQSGHGLSIVIPDNSRAVAIWHAYDLDGNPLTLYLDGSVHGREVVGPVFAPSGMRFPWFDPAELVLPTWGEARIQFNSCDEAELSWQADWPGYPDGDLTLRRLAAVQGTVCELPRSNQWAEGLYSGTIQLSPRVSGQMSGIVDSLGQLWAIETTRIRWTGEEHYGHRFAIIAGTPQTSNGDKPVAQPFLLLPHNHSASFRAFGEHFDIVTEGANTGVSEEQAQYHPETAQFEFEWTRGHPYQGQRFYDVELRGPGNATDETLVAPVSSENLAGQYRALDWDTGDEPSPADTIGFSVDEAGHGCLHLEAGQAGQDCLYRIQFDFTQGDTGIIPILFSFGNLPSMPAIQGRAWLTQRGNHDQLHIMARGHTRNFGFVVTR